MGFLEDLINTIIFVCVIIIVALVTYYIAWRFVHRKTKLNIDTTKDINSYIVKLYRKIGDSYIEVDEKKVKPKAGKFRIDNKDFGAFDTEKIAYSSGKHKYYAFDYDSGGQLFFNEKKLPENVSIEDIDNYVNKGIIAQILKGLENLKTDKTQYMMLIIGVIIGALTGFVIGNIILPNTQQPNIPTTTKFILSLFGVFY